MEDRSTSETRSVAGGPDELRPPGMLPPIPTRSPGASGPTTHGSPHVGLPSGHPRVSGCARPAWACRHRRGARPAVYPTAVWAPRGTLAAAATLSRARPRPQSLPEPLSERELEVLRLVALGRSNADIARELVVEVATVKTHLNNLYRKLDVHSRTQAVARVGQLRLLQP